MFLARLLRPDQPLREYRWSSWPEYLKRPRRRWPWLRVDRLLGEYRVPKDSDPGRQHLEGCVETRRMSEDLAACKQVRWGWCLGDNQFRKELLAGMAERMGYDQGPTGEAIEAGDDRDVGPDRGSSADGEPVECIESRVRAREVGSVRRMSAGAPLGVAGCRRSPDVAIGPVLAKVRTDTFSFPRHHFGSGTEMK